MINDNVLGNILNEFKEKSNPQTQPPEFQTNSILTFVNSIMYGIFFSFKVLILGFGTKIIFSTDWKFIEIICMGFLINYAMNYILDFIHEFKCKT